MRGLDRIKQLLACKKGGGIRPGNPVNADFTPTVKQAFYKTVSNYYLYINSRKKYEFRTRASPRVPAAMLQSPARAPSTW